MKNETKDRLIGMAVDIIVVGSLIAFGFGLLKFVCEALFWAWEKVHGG
jgi:hypothetical protein